nr:hypothetical protein GCM10020185_18150 [Pseudomonas brassicacearum subsp. brassicacearum]
MGNECEQYGELELRQDLFTLDDGSVLSVDGMASLYNRYDRTPTFQGENGSARMPQMYAQWSNMPSLNGGSLWAGRRYYKRNDIHISDFYYWNQSATGGGIEDVLIGGLKYSYAFSRKDNLYQKDPVNRHDFNVAGFKANPGGELEFGLSFIDRADRRDAHRGWALTAQHVQQDFLGGKNKLALQYGEGPGTGLGYTGDTGLDDSNKSYRLVEFFSIGRSRHVSAGRCKRCTRRTSTPMVLTRTGCRWGFARHTPSPISSSWWLNWAMTRFRPAMELAS